MAAKNVETFVVNEIIKSFINEGLEYKFSVFYYRGKDKKKTRQNGETIETENEIDFIIEENGVLYPIEIKKSAKPTKSMADAFNVLDKDVDKQRGLGVILCLYDEKLYLKDDLVVLPIEYL